MPLPKRACHENTSISRVFLIQNWRLGYEI
jgi:hypothetical protein